MRTSRKVRFITFLFNSIDGTEFYWDFEMVVRRSTSRNFSRSVEYSTPHTVLQFPYLAAFLSVASFLTYIIVS